MQANQKEILALQAKFYQQLYKADAEITFTFVNQGNNKLNENDKLNLERPPSLEELATSVKAMQSGKTPG